MEIDVPLLQDLEFEEQCRWCYGLQGHSCVRCEGRGYTVTDVGKRLIQFLKKRGVLMKLIEGDE